MVPLSSLIFCPSFIITYFESFICLAWMLEKVKFWRTQTRDPTFWCRKFCEVLSFLNICLFWKFDVSSWNNWKVWILVAPFERGILILVPPILSYFIFNLYLSILKISFVNRECLKSLNFSGPVWGGPLFWYPQILSNFIFLVYLLSLKISCVQLRRLKSLNFGGLHLGGLPILEPPIFVGFDLFLISTHSKNLNHLAITV